MLTARRADSAAIPHLFLVFARWSLAFLLILAGFGMGIAVGPQYISARNAITANIALIFAASPMYHVEGIARIETWPEMPTECGVVQT